MEATETQKLGSPMPPVLGSLGQGELCEGLVTSIRHHHLPYHARMARRAQHL